MPKMVVLDLDYTLWNLWCDTHVSPPLKRRGNDVNAVYDKYGEKVAFYPDVPELLVELHRSGVHLAVASRTHAPKVARQILTELLIPGTLNNAKDDPTRPAQQLVSAIKLFDSMEIYPGSKTTHMTELHKKTGIEFDEMLFFDDESRNREVTKLGVRFVLAPKGLSRSLFTSGVEAWRKQLSQKPQQAGEDPQVGGKLDNL